MKKLITICVGLIVAGCAATSQLEETKGQLAAADTKIQDLEKRLARIEGDLYRVEVKSAPKVDKPEPPKPAEPKFVPAKEVEKNVIDTKIDAFLKEYLGVQFGDSIDKFPEVFNNRDSNTRVIPVLKKFKYFDNAMGVFLAGKLFSVQFYGDIEEKYSIDSTNEKIDQSLAGLAVSFGLSSEAFRTSGFASKVKNNTSYDLEKRYNFKDPVLRYRFSTKDIMEGKVKVIPKDGYRRYAASITDLDLRRQLEIEKIKADKEARRKANATGEPLPDPE